MNERIIKIGLESGMLNYVDNETPRHYFLSSHADEQDLAKFAELIVAECIKLNSKELSIKAIERLLPLYEEHFGVEE